MHTSLISAKKLAQKLDNPNWRVVDCRFSLDAPERGKNDYRIAHIPGAVYAHLDDDLSAPVVPGKTGRHPLPEIEQLAALFSKWGIDAGVQVVVYDDGPGAIAARLWWLLRWLGHQAVAVLDGGWQGWQKNGYPTSAELPQRSQRKFVAHLQNHLLVDSEFVEQQLRSNDYLLIDSRAADRYDGSNETIDPVAGHIPSAVNVQFASNLTGDGQFRDPQDLQNHFRKTLGHKKPQQAVFYCGSGVTACHNVLALFHAGLGDAKLYAGSWSEWITDPQRPIVTPATK